MNNFLKSNLHKILNEITKFDYPTDKYLSLFFKKNKKFGKKDRFFLSEIVFFYLRNKRLIDYYDSKEQTSDSKINHLINLYENFEKSNGIQFFYSLNVKEKFPIDLLFSVPKWLFDKLKKDFNESFAIKFSEFSVLRSNLTLRTNNLKISRDNLINKFEKLKIKASKTKYSPHGIFVQTNINLRKTDLYNSGLFEFQDEGSQLIADLVNANNKSTIVDFCAGAGGKTLSISLSMRGRGRVYAFDISEKKLLRLRERLNRLQLSNVITETIGQTNNRRIKRLWGKVDKVLVDAPCMGFGTVRRNPDLLWKYNEENLATITKDQFEILSQASRLVKPNGELIYATCSILKEENEDIINRFIKTNKEFKVKEMDYFFEKSKINEKSNFLKTFPNYDQMDGFFGAILVKAI